MKDLSIIIVSYNVKHYLEQCLHSVFAASEGLEVEVFVVDNASTDGSTDFLRQRFPHSDYPNLRIIDSGNNLGFGKANNLAVKMAHGRYVLFLNPDTVITEHTLGDCLRFADAHPQLGALGVKMLKDNGTFAYESRRGLPTPWTAFCKMSGLASVFPHSRLFGRYYLRYLDKEEAAEIDIISGAFMMARREALEKVGLFDEQFFMYGEDIDLSYRLLLGGYKNYYLPTPILHYKGESTQKNSYRYVHVFYQAMLLFFRKHYRQASLLLALPVQMAILGRALCALMARKWNGARESLFPPRPQAWRCCYVGRNAEQALALARHFGLEMTCVEADATTHEGGHEMLEEAREALFVAYDMEQFNYGDVLRNFADGTHHRYMGFFYPDTSTLVTGGDIYVLPDNHRR